MSGPLIATPCTRSTKDSQKLSPSIPTPTPFNQFFGSSSSPTLAFSSPDFGSSEWGREDAMFLQDCLVSRCSQLSAVTPGATTVQPIIPSSNCSLSALCHENTSVVYKNRRTETVTKTSEPIFNQTMVRQLKYIPKCTTSCFS